MIEDRFLHCFYFQKKELSCVSKEAEASLRTDVCVRDLPVADDCGATEMAVKET